MQPDALARYDRAPARRSRGGELAGTSSSTQLAISQACVDWLTRAPAIASEFEIEIMPYDREVVRKAVERELAVDGDERMGLMASYGAWFCGHLGCELGRGDELDKWLGGALAKLPETWPTK